MTEREELLRRHLSESNASLPGPDYYQVLGWIHNLVRPRIYLEIGVRAGASLALAKWSEKCIGIDPAPAISLTIPSQTSIYPNTSDQFFSTVERAAVLSGDYFDFGFIDGAHIFEQSLRDFINLERWSGVNSLIAIHDCIPLNSVTAARVRTTDFYSGDVWKLALCLKTARPDLRIAIVKTPPTGLCLVSGLDNNSEVLLKRYDELLEIFITLPFDGYTAILHDSPDHIPNTLEAVTNFIEKSSAWS